MNRQLRSILEETEGGRRYLAQIDGEKRARARRVAAKPKAPGKTRAERRTVTNDETAALRKQAEERARRWGWVGELCGNPLPLFPDLSTLALRPELCHLDGGTGSRTQDQWIGNVLFEHHECHQGPLGLDKKPLVWLPAVKTWCERHGYPLPARFRRLEAKEEARSSRALEGRR